MKIIDLNKIIEQRVQRIILITKVMTEKIVKRELRKLKKDVIKNIVRVKK